MTTEFNYKYIKPLLKEENLDGNILKCTFQASNQDLPLVAKHVLILSELDDESNDLIVSKNESFKISSAWKSLFKSNQKKEKVVSIYDQIPLTGNQRLLENRTLNPTENNNLSTKIIKEAVVNAFKNIASYYVFDGNQWVYAPNSG